MNKVIEISLIENSKKKKKQKEHGSSESILAEYKYKIINDLEEVISIKFFNNNTSSNKTINNKTNKSSLEFIEIRNKFIKFYNAYIELNGLFIEKKKEDQIIKEIINELITNVVYRTDNLNLIPEKEEIKEVCLLKEIAEKIAKANIVDLEL
jgi:hypothetical protein